MRDLKEIAWHFSSEIENIIGGEINDFFEFKEILEKNNIKLIKDINLYVESAKTIKGDKFFNIHYNSYNNLNPISYRLKYEITYCFVQGLVEYYDEESSIESNHEIYYIGKKAQLIKDVTTNLLVPVRKLSKELEKRIDLENRIYDLKGIEHVFEIERNVIEYQGRRYNFFKA